MEENVFTSLFQKYFMSSSYLDDTRRKKFDRSNIHKLAISMFAYVSSRVKIEIYLFNIDICPGKFSIKKNNKSLLKFVFISKRIGVDILDILHFVTYLGAVQALIAKGNGNLYEFLKFIKIKHF